MLEGLGWRIHRIWSTDWFRFPDRELRKAAKAIEAAKVPVPDPSPGAPPKTDNRDANTEEEEHETTPVVDPPKPKPQKHSATEKYRVAELAISTDGRDLHPVQPYTMADWIPPVVEIESPVHLSEVTRRIAKAVGVRRIDSGFLGVVKAAARQAVRSESIQMEGDFLYWTAQEQVPVRNRDDLPKASRKLELIAPEEIEMAIKQVVSDAFGIKRDDLPREVCQLFGFKATENRQRQVNKVVDGMIKGKQLIQQGDTLKL